MEPEYKHEGHRISPIAWHCIKNDTRIPIHICYDCGCMLNSWEFLNVDIQGMLHKGDKMK